MTRLPATTVNDDSLRRNIGVSAGLHIAFVLFLIFGLPSMMKPLPMPSMPIPIDIVDVAELTNTRLKDQTPEPPKPPEQPPPPEQKVAPPPPTPPAPATPPKPVPVESKPAAVEAITPEVKPAEKPTPPKPVVEKPHQDLLASVLKNVEKMKPAEMVKTPPAPTKPQTQVQPKSMAPSLSDRLTISENDMLVRQVEQHWNVPIGARDIQNIVVQIHIDVNPDRSVQHAEIISNSSMSGNQYYRAVAESALRAVYASSPLQLPEGKYEQWKGIDINFSAKDML